MPQLTIEELDYITICESRKINRHCIKTGKLLTQIPFIEVEQLIRIHSPERAKMVILQLQQSIALEWILTDDIALQCLAKEQPVEYLIYAVSALLTKPSPDSTLAIMEDFEIKIAANVFLKTLPFELIANCSELTRRILASNRPIAIQEMLNSISMKNILLSLEDITKFQLTLQECLKQIGLGYYDDAIVNQRNRHKKELFAKQKQLAALTDLEKEINASLPMFDEIEMPVGELRQIIMGNMDRKATAILKHNRNANKQSKKLSLNSFKGTNTFGGVKFAKGKKS